MHMEIWAHCEACQRWYYCVGRPDDPDVAPACPVCCRAPRTFENRATPTRAPEPLQQWGRREVVDA